MDYTYSEQELEDIHKARLPYPEFAFLVSRFKRHAVDSFEYDANSLSDFEGWLEQKEDEYKLKNHARTK